MTWTDATLEDLVLLQRGFDITKAEQRDGQIPVISSSGVQSYHNVAKVDGPGVIVGRKGSVGTVYYCETDYWPHDTTLWSKDLKGNDAKFVAYFLRTLNLQRFDTGNSNPTLNRNHIHSQRIRKPDLPTQQRIASMLSAYDNLIENNRRRVALLEQAARLLYREWFVHLRFPGHETAKIVDGLPNGWSKPKLGDVCSTNKKSHKAGKLPPRLRYIDIGSVSTGRVDQATEMAAEEAPGRARRIADDGNTIWSNVRPNLRAYALVMAPRPEDVFSTGFTVLHAETVSPYFLYLAVTTDDFVKYLENHATGVGYPAVRAGDFERALVIKPTDALMAKFHELCQPMFSQRQQLFDQSAQLTRARDLLLPRLMDGRIPV